MLSGLLLASQFWLMSDRASFWDAEKISNHTEFMQGSNLQKTTFDSEKIKGKNILLLVHGYNNDPEEALSTYRLINIHVSAFKDSRHSKFYDFIIGYLWPGDDSSLKYYDAKLHVSKLATTMRSHLEFLSDSAAKVDVLAHSMGNRLMFEALNYQFNMTKKIVNNFYSLAAAVDDESIETNEKYYLSVQNCEKMFIFYSKRDDVLKWYYSLVEWDKALGYEGAENPKKLPENVELINYTNLISQHSQYFTILPVYEFIKKQFLISNSEKHNVLKTARRAVD
jgi:esterase/lipase superfamily enzyme